MTKMIIPCMLLVSLICSGCVSDTLSGYLSVTEKSYTVKSEITDDVWMMLVCTSLYSLSEYSQTTLEYLKEP